MGQILIHPLQPLLTHPIHQMAFAYWMRRRRLTGAIPGRQDIDPIEIPSLLPWVNLIDVHRQPDGLAFRHRLVGTGIVDAWDRDSTGQWFHKLYQPRKLANMQPTLEEIVQLGEPAVLRDDLREVGKPHRTASTLIMPLASDGRRVDMLLAVSQYD